MVEFFLVGDVSIAFSVLDLGDFLRLGHRRNMRINVSASVFGVRVDVKLVLFDIEFCVVDVDLIARRIAAKWRDFNT